MFIFHSQVVKEAARIRNFDRLEDHRADRIPDVNMYGYHMKCYQEFTHKQKLERLQRNKNQAAEEQLRRSSRQAGSSGISII